MDESHRGIFRTWKERFCWKI